MPLTRRNWYRQGLFCLLLCLWLGTCNAAEVRVYAAASLTDVIDQLADIYRSLHPQTTIKTSFAGSATLARQIEKGAPADLFISADQDWADYLQTRGLLEADSRRILVRNALVLLVPKGRELSINFSADKPLAEQFHGRLCTGDPDFVPVGKYAREALSQLGWWDGVAPRLVGTESVRVALAYVERGECALGIVYATDAHLSTRTSLLAHFPTSSHSPIVYPGALLPGAGSEARGFWQFLQSPEAAAVFAARGFIAKTDWHHAE